MLSLCADGGEVTPMPTIRTLRLHYGMSMVELAMASGVPVRRLGAIEYGLEHLDRECAVRFARIFGLSPEALLPQQARGARSSQLQRAGATLTAALLSGILLLQAPTALQPALLWLRATAASSMHATPTAIPTPRASQLPLPSRLQVSLGNRVVEQPTVVPQAHTTDVQRFAATPQPQPTFWLDERGPHGCPIDITDGQIVVTQFYGEGSHAPANVWGAIDLAIDADGDGYAEPSATNGVRVVATHDGIARVYPNSWPAGNMVLLEHSSGWTTGYAHLSSFAVSDGQEVQAGMPLGVVGSTGLSTGPHLHYEVRYGGSNHDPLDLVPCVAPTSTE